MKRALLAAVVCALTTVGAHGFAPAEPTTVSLAHTIDKEKAADNPRPLGQEMVLDAGGHAMDLYTIWYHGSVITHIDALCHYSFEGNNHFSV